MFTESLLKKLPKNVSEIEFKEDHKNYKIIKVDDPDTDDEDDDIEVENKELVKAEENTVAEIPISTNVIDLISDDEDDNNEIATTTTTNNNNQVTTTTIDTITVNPPNKRSRTD
jgi:hypothetical protein